MQWIQQLSQDPVVSTSVRMLIATAAGVGSLSLVVLGMKHALGTILRGVDNRRRAAHERLAAEDDRKRAAEAALIRSLQPQVATTTETRLPGHHAKPGDTVRFLHDLPRHVRYNQAGHDVKQGDEGIVARIYDPKAGILDIRGDGFARPTEVEVVHRGA